MRVDRHYFYQTLFGGGAVITGGVFIIPGESARGSLGLPAGPARSQRALAERDLVQPLRLTRIEAERGGRKRVEFNGDHGLEELLVTVPPGIRAETRLRLRGRGRVGPGGTRGDLYLVVEITDEEGPVRSS